MGLFLDSAFSAAGLDCSDFPVVPLVEITSKLRRALERFPARDGGLPLDTGVAFFPEFLELPLLAGWLCLGVFCCERDVELADSACFDLLFERPPLLFCRGSLTAAFFGTLLNNWEKRKQPTLKLLNLFLHEIMIKIQKTAILLTLPPLIVLPLTLLPLQILLRSLPQTPPHPPFLPLSLQRNAGGS